MAGESNGITLLNFLFLAAIRGTTPLMSYLAVTRLNSASLVVGLKCAISLVMFCLSTIVTLTTEEKAVRLQIKSNLGKKSTYWKVLVIGLIQGTAPYLLAVKSLEYLPPTLMAVFMAATPWFTIIFERTPCVKVRTRVTSVVILGMILGFAGLFLIVGPAIHESEKNCRMINHGSTNVTNASSKVNVDRTYNSEFPYDVCLSSEKVAFGTLSLIAASFLWAWSTIFWRTHRGDIHFSVASIGQNLVGAVLSLCLWIAFERSHVIGEVYWDEALGIVGFVFLGVCSGWLATLLVQLLSKKIGPKSTNQVLVALPIIAFIEDCIFVKDVITIHPWVIAIEVIGLLLISLGTLFTNLPLGHKKRKHHGPLSETLLNTEYSEGTLDPVESDNEGPEVTQYQMLDESDKESIVSKEEEQEEEITTRKGSQSGLKDCSTGHVI